MRCRPANASTPAAVSAHTRVMMAPTVRQAIRISSVIARFEHWVANQATCWSNEWVCPAPCRAQGTCRTVGPWAAQLTRGASASRKTWMVPTSRPRHRRRPGPRSYQEALDPQVRSSRPHVGYQNLCLVVELDVLDHGALDAQQDAP